MLVFYHNPKQEYPVLRDEIWLDREYLSEIFSEGDMLSMDGISIPWSKTRYDEAREIVPKRIQNVNTDLALKKLNQQIRLSGKGFMSDYRVIRNGLTKTQNVPNYRFIAHNREIGKWLTDSEESLEPTIMQYE